MAFLPITLDRDFVIQTRHYDLPSAYVWRAMHGYQITIQDPCVSHAHAVNAQQEMRWLSEHLWIDLITRFNMFLGQDRLTCGNTPHQGQPHLLADGVFEANTSRSAGQEFEYTLPL